MEALYHKTYTEYYLTDRAFPVFDRKDVDAPLDAPLHPPSDSMSYSHNRSNNKNKVITTTPESTFRINSRDILNQQRQMLLKKSPCEDAGDIGLNHETTRWIKAGICLMNNCNCKAAENFCVPWIEKLSAKIVRFTSGKGKPILPGREKKYVCKMLAEITSKKGGD